MARRERTYSSDGSGGATGLAGRTGAYLPKGPMRVVVFSSATLLTIVLGFGTRTLIGQPDDVVFHDMATIPKAPYGPYLDARAVLTETCSVVIATLPPRWRQTPHHHTQEQVTIGREGPLGYVIDGILHELGRHGAGLPPSDVEHGMVNDSDSQAVVLEYQPVLRREWLPPHPQVPPQPQAPQARRILANAPVAIDFDTASGGWDVASTGTRRKTLTGQTIRATFWDFARTGASIDIAINPTSRERLVFVLDGHATAESARARRIVGPEMLIEVRPGARNIVLRSQQSEPSMIVVLDTSGQ
jgi:quercetin dioxygenase-like cupin family protein